MGEDLRERCEICDTVMEDGESWECVQCNKIVCHGCLHPYDSDFCKKCIPGKDSLKEYLSESVKGKSKDFFDGFRSGINTFAWMKNGIYYVGTMIRPLMKSDKKLMRYKRRKNDCS